LVRFTPEARLDVLTARDWYESRTPGVGLEFVRMVDVAVSSMDRFPQAFPQVHGEARKAVLRRFPYSLLFVPDDECLVVLGCFHHRQAPEAWARRL